jgi:hypothetical protein
MSSERQKCNLIYCFNGRRRERDADMRGIEDWKKCGER